MKMMPVFILLLLLAGCVGDDTIVHEEDYTAFITGKAISVNHQLEQVDADHSFWWDRLQKHPNDHVSQNKLASILSSRFMYSGNIKDLHLSDSLYLIVNRLNKINSSATYRSLAKNCITQHNFKMAKSYIDSAIALGDNKFISLLMLFDVQMELGDYQAAAKALQIVSNNNSFAYLIRKAKYEDQVNGDLDKAIELMEKAAGKFDPADNSLYCWTYSNLGDMYGHANRFEDAYKCYLDVLKKNAEDFHSLKGIAWLAFSHDKNIPAAKRIISFLQKKHPVPDYELLLAEIEAYEGNMAAVKKHLNKFQQMSTFPPHGDMYNKYLFNVKADMLNDVNGAATIAKREIKTRPTAASYSLLAWSYYQLGDINKAKYILQNYVERWCFEPDVLLRTGLIYKAAGDVAKAKKYLLQAKESSFELGPFTADQIEEALKTI